MCRSYRCYHIEEGIIIVLADRHGSETLLQIQNTFIRLNILKYIGYVFRIEGNVDVRSLHRGRYGLFCLANVGIVGSYMNLALGKAESYDVVLIGS